jgi:hypothetical protein
VHAVFATLFCGPAATATAHSSSVAGVAIEANGDFRIDDALTPAPPRSCDSPVLLIVSALRTSASGTVRTPATEAGTG